MTNVTRIDWTIQTGDQWWSGTDSRIQMEIYRDNDLIKRLNLEPGNTPRLHRGEFADYFWVFQDPDGLGTSVSGTTVPYSVRFPNGVDGHLRVKFVSKGDDAWEKVSIESIVTSGELQYIPGTIDGLRWVENFESFFFGQDVVISTDTSEGHPTWTLLY